MVKPTVRRVLVVYKTSPYDRYDEAGVLEIEGADDLDRRRILDRLGLAHRENAASAAVVSSALTASGVVVLQRQQPTKAEIAGVDLLIAVGGDGTFLRTAQRDVDVPMLGVNSSPSTSVGHYCGATAEDFGDVLEAILTGTIAPSPLTRIGLHVGARQLPHYALNDVLLAHRSPAASARYLLRIGDRSELQTSSGVWVSTASGSTGAIHSAGAAALPPEERRLQYLVREPFSPPAGGPVMVSGMLDEQLLLVSRSPHLAVFLDGHHRSYQVGFGTAVRIARAERPLPVFAYRGRSA